MAPGALSGSPDFTTTCLRDLDSDSIQTREAASTSLKAWAKNSPDKLLTLITSSSTPEQRERLLELGRNAFMNSDRGAMGVSFAQTALRGVAFNDDVFEEGIPIDGTIQGFDSANVLKGGDLLRSIGGVRVRTNLECRVQIISYDPGQQVRLEIEREGRPMFVTLHLGRWDDLRNPVNQSSDRLADSVKQAAWRARAARVTAGLVAEPALEPLPGTLAWVEADRLSTPAAEKVDEAHDANLQVRADGQQLVQLLQGAGQLEAEAAPGPQADLVATGSPRGKVKNQAASNRAFARRNMVQNDRDALVLQLTQGRLELRDLQNRLDIVRLALQDPKLTPAERAENLQYVQILENQRTLVQNRVNQLGNMLRVP